jgi:hypothetical protein
MYESADADEPALAAEQTSRIPQEDPEAPSPYWLDDICNCGPRCLHFVDRWFGGNRTFRDVSVTCPPGREGVSLADLESAAKQFGWGATPFAGGASTLPRLRHAAILHVEPTKKYDPNANWGKYHFIVLLGYDPQRGEHLIYDPPGDVRRVSRRYLAQRYTGLGLLVAKDRPPELATALEPHSPWPPLALLAALVAAWGGPALVRRLAVRNATAILLLAAATLAAGSAGCSRGAAEAAPSPREYQAGDVIEGKKIAHVFHLENGSDRPFNVTNISASCTCTHSSLDELAGPLAPGARRPLKVEFDTRGERGAQRKTIVVETDSQASEWRAIEFVVEAGGLALGALLLVLAVGVGLTVPGGLSSPGEEALSAVRGGSCTTYTNCTQADVCVSQFGTGFYYHYTGVGIRWFDTEDLYDLGQCRYIKVHVNDTTCSNVPQDGAVWWICS